MHAKIARAWFERPPFTVCLSAAVHAHVAVMRCNPGNLMFHARVLVAARPYCDQCLGATRCRNRRSVMVVAISPPLRNG
jgi:hypothetical protein